MEIKWLEDFLVLATTRSFSRAAEERNTTQSTLSRRIQQLEDWLGVRLIDRSSQPVGLTRAGSEFYRESVAIVRTVYRARAGARRIGLQGAEQLRISAQHVLARHFLPRLLARIEADLDIGGVTLRSDNLYNCVDDLMNDEVDFMICFHQPAMPDLVDLSGYDFLVVGTEEMIPVSLPDDSGAPRFALPGTAGAPVPCIGFSSENPLGWHRQARMTAQDIELHINPVYESTMGEIIRDMVLNGRGMAWLQTMLVGGDLTAGRLVRAGDATWDQSIEIRLFRTRAVGRGAVDQIWGMLRDGGFPPCTPDREPG